MSTSTEPVIAGSRGFALALLAPLTEKVGTRPRIATDPAAAGAFCGGGALVVVEYLGPDTLRGVEALMASAKGVRVVVAVPERLAAADASLRALGAEVARWTGAAEPVLTAVGRSSAAAPVAAAPVAAAPVAATPAGATPAGAAARPVARPAPTPASVRGGPAPNATAAAPPRPAVRATSPAAAGAAQAAHGPIATPVPVARPTATPVPAGRPTATPVPVARPTATPVPAARTTARPTPPGMPATPQGPAGTTAADPALRQPQRIAPPVVSAPPAPAAARAAARVAAPEPARQASPRAPAPAAAPPPPPPWPTAIPGPDEAAGALQHVFAGGPPGIPGVLEALASLSDVERSVLAGAPLAVDPRPIRAAAVMRVRVAAALATVPPEGGEVDAAAVSALLAEIDALLSEVAALAPDAPPAAQASLDGLRNALVKDAIDFSEAAQRVGPGASAEAAPRPAPRQPHARLISVDATPEPVARSHRGLWIALAVAVVAVGGHRGWRWYELHAKRSAALHAPGIPAGFIELQRAPGTPRTLVHVRTDERPDPAELQHFRVAEEAKGNVVTENDGILYVTPAPQVPATAAPHPPAAADPGRGAAPAPGAPASAVPASP